MPEGNAHDRQQVNRGVNIVRRGVVQVAVPGREFVQRDDLDHLVYMA